MVRFPLGDSWNGIDESQGLSGGFFLDSGAQENLGVVQMGRPKLQCCFRDACDKCIQELSVFIVQRGYVEVPGAQKGHHDVLDGETTDPCASPGFTFQEAVSDEALYRNAGSGPRRT
jgi:hypothetical protein